MNIVITAAELAYFSEKTGGTAIALGLFDGVHRGHQRVIQTALSCQAIGTPLVFTFTTKHLCPQGKSKAKPILTIAERLEEMQRLGMQAVYLPDFSDFHDLTAKAFVRDLLVKQLRAKVLCCGENFRFGKNAEGDTRLLQQLCEASGIQLKLVSAATDEGGVISSTRIRSALAAGDMAAVAAMLGRQYQIKQVVRAGNQIGRTLGFPTLNQWLCEDLCLPRYGVYCSETLLPGRAEPCPSLTNIGVRPSVGGSDVPLAETYLLSGTYDLYGQEVTVSLLSFLRPERTFSSLEDLTAQIKQDQQHAQAYFGG